MAEDKTTIDAEWFKNETKRGFRKWCRLWVAPVVGTFKEYRDILREELRTDRETK